MARELQNINDVYEQVGITTRAPFIAHYRDKLGVWYNTSFEDAPTWKYWDKLGHFQQVILGRISH